MAFYVCVVGASVCLGLIVWWLLTDGDPPIGGAS